MNSTSSNSAELWQRYKQHLYHNAEMNFSLDISRMNFPDTFFNDIEPRLTLAYQAMAGDGKRRDCQSR